jgi:hypothetical protein
MANAAILFVEKINIHFLQIFLHFQDKPMYTDQYRFLFDCHQQLL